MALRFWILVSLISAGFLQSCANTGDDHYSAYSRFFSLQNAKELGFAGSGINVYYHDLVDNPDNVVLFVTGSGCRSVTTYLPAYFRDLQGSYRIVTIEKPEAIFSVAKCSQEHYRQENFSNRLKKNRALLNWLITEKNKGKYKKLVLFGFYTGGPIVSRLVHENDYFIDAAVITSFGGLGVLDNARILAKKGKTDLEIERIEEKVKSDPNSLELISYRTIIWWSSFAGAAPGKFLQGTTTPALFVLGEADEEVPIESLDLFSKRDFPNITTLKIPNADGHFLSLNADLMPVAAAHISRWLTRLLKES